MGWLNLCIIWYTETVQNP